MSDAQDPGDAPRLPPDFSVEDILRAPLRAREPGAPPSVGSAVAPHQEARSALWELDFALRELEWFHRASVAERPLLESVARQIVMGAVYVERFPLEHLPMPDDLVDALSDRFTRISDALQALPTGWVGHEDLARAHACLRSSLERRDVDID